MSLNPDPDMELALHLPTGPRSDLLIVQLDQIPNSQCAYQVSDVLAKVDWKFLKQFRFHTQLANGLHIVPAEERK